MPQAFDCCPIPKAVEARTIESGCDRRAFSRRNFRAGEVILTNLPTSHVLLHQYRKERCARCLSTTRKGDPPHIKNNLLRCGGCKQVWYCSRDCQKQDFFFHKVECKEVSIIFQTGTGQPESNRSSLGETTINNAALLVRNFLALRVRKINECYRSCGDNGGSHIRCGSDHFDNLLQYNNKLPLDREETLDIQRASRALWNQRKSINKMVAKTTATTTIPENDYILHYSFPQLEKQLERDLRRFRTNNFGVTDFMVRVVASAVYPLGALLNHSCDPNCLLRYDCGSRNRKNEPPLLEIVAARDISAGEELTHSYVELVSPAHTRRISLRDTYGFECRCEKCSFANSNICTNSTTEAAGASARFQIALPYNHRSLPPTELSRWVLEHYNPSRCSKVFEGDKNDESSLVFVNQETILEPLDNSEYTAAVEAATAKQQEAQYFMLTEDLDSEVASLKDVVKIFESSLVTQTASTRPLLSLDLYKARCAKFGTLMTLIGESNYSKEALVECEHIVSFLCLALKHVPNHSLLGLQLFTLGDMYEANNESDKAHTTYAWARKVLRISQGNTSDMVQMLNSKTNFR